jgi:hypothetical protein
MQDGAAAVMDEVITPIRVEIPGMNGGDLLKKSLMYNLHQITPEK